MPGCRGFNHILLVFVILASFPLAAQEEEDQKAEIDELYRELDSLFADETIPANLFQLADSLLALEKVRVSALQIRAGYMSDVLTAGRALGINQYGFVPGINYFHYTGLFAGVTGYWSNEYDPGYYLTNVSVGYMGEVKKKFNYILNHDFFIYSDSIQSHLFNKSAEASLSYQFNWADITGEYAFLYGESTAHRITAHFNLRFRWKFRGFIDAVTVMPAITGQWGNADVLYLRQPRTAAMDLYQIVKSNDYPALTRREYARLTYLLESDRTPAATYFLRQRNYSNAQIDQLFNEYYDGSVLSENTFGFMNYSFSVPVIIRSGAFSLLLNYTYNLPQALPGESFTYENTGYFSASLAYMFPWQVKTKKKN